MGGLLLWGKVGFALFILGVCGKSQAVVGGDVQGGDSLEATCCSGGISPLFHNFLNLERRFWNQILTWERKMENSTKMVNKYFSPDQRPSPLMVWFYVLFIAHEVDIWQHMEPGLRCAHLCLRKAERRRQLGPFRQSQILRLLKPPLKCSQLEAGINGSRFSDFLWFSINHPDFWLALFFLWKSNTFTLCSEGRF